MKALSIRQPGADEIASGQKWLEFRSRPTNYRGKLLICSSKFDEGYSVTIGQKEKPLPLGVMLAIVDVVDSRPMRKEDLAHPGAPETIDGWYVWEFSDYLELVKPKPVSGRVNFFNVSDSDIEILPEDKFWFDYL